MKTSQRNMQVAITGRNAHRGLGGLLLSCFLVSVPVAASAQGSFGLSALLNPSQALQEARERGRGMIYDKVDNDVVQPAVDSQIERVKHAVSTRTQRTATNGEVTVDDNY